MPSGAMICGLPGTTATSVPWICSARHQGAEVPAKLGDSCFVAGAELVHRLVPVAGDRQMGHAPEPSGAHAGDFMQDV